MDKARCGRVSCCYLLICSLLPPAYLHLPPALLTCPTLPCPIPPQPKPTPHPNPLHFQAWPPFWCQQWDSACTSPLPLSLSSSSSIRRHSISSLLLSLFLLLLLSFPQPAGPSSPTAAPAPAPAVQLGEQRGSTGEVATTPSVLKSTFFSSFFSSHQHHRRPVICFSSSSTTRLRNIRSCIDSLSRKCTDYLCWLWFNYHRLFCCFPLQCHSGSSTPAPH